MTHEGKQLPERWTIGGETYRAAAVELLDGQPAILLTLDDDPQWDEVWTLAAQDDDQADSEV